ncbi:type II toxin-antitoxin system YoeB family toxin [Streptomyces californicus]
MRPGGPPPAGPPLGRPPRRITDEHRLIHKVVDDEVRVAACRYHYGR